ncbi:antitoxin [Nevskia sp.]|uniref:antitoxin n=1 Tax=Nevskia sp. TaxID=1929292 RepID=UPI0025CDE70F|nr:type II toxin-antitoxin system VapB family antitoxin [Nevskia sp.]
MNTAKIFQSGNSQAVRLPKEFRFAASEVEIFRRGAEIVLRERRPSLAALLAELEPWPDDITAPDELPQQTRDYGALP